MCVATKCAIILGGGTKKLLFHTVLDIYSVLNEYTFYLITSYLIYLFIFMLMILNIHARIILFPCL